MAAARNTNKNPLMNQHLLKKKVKVQGKMKVKAKNPLPHFLLQIILLVIAKILILIGKIGLIFLEENVFEIIVIV